MPIAVSNKLSLWLDIDDEYIRADLVNNVLSKFNLVESTMLYCPIAEVTFTDDTGVLIDNYDRLSAGIIKYNVGFPNESGTSNTFEYEHYLFSQRPSQLFTGMTTNSVTFDIVTWDKIGPDLMIKDEVKSFDGEKSASEVIKEIVEDLGLEEGVIEDSQDKRHYIQAQWTNAQFIRYLSKHAESGDGVRGFLYFIDREGKFSFCSPKYLYDQNKGSAIKLTFTNNPAYAEEHKDEAVLSWRFVSRAQKWIVNSGYGSRFKFYDREEYKYDEEEKKIKDDVSKFNTTEYTLLNEDFEDYLRSESVGTKQVDEFKLMTRSMNSLMDLLVVIKYNDSVKLGSVIKFYMPIQDIPEREQKTMLDMIGSEWVVSHIKHMVDKGSMTYYMRLILTRSGVAQKDAQRLIQ